MGNMVRIPGSPHKPFVVSESPGLLFSPPFLTINDTNGFGFGHLDFGKGCRLDGEYFVLYSGFFCVMRGGFFNFPSPGGEDLIELERAEEEDAYPDLDDVRQPVVPPEPGRDVGAGLGHLAAGAGAGAAGRD